ncbi:MAG: RNase adapter RapZ, partial [Deltaproteobacteria bacterium]|nr:RNase adapter RapZ [Deltaproteobacteria bacterium]
PLDGTHPDVQNFVLKQKDSQAFIRELKKLFKFLIPRYMKEGKSYLTIGFGCTGGKHRSVTLAHYFKKYFEGEGLYTSVEDRDRKRQ